MTNEEKNAIVLMGASFALGLVAMFMVFLFGFVSFVRPSKTELRARDFCMGLSWRLRSATEHGDLLALHALSETDEPYLCTGRNLTPTIEDGKAMEREIRSEIGATP